jgi:hypothetical protein
VITQREYIESCRVRFNMDDVTEIMPAAIWIWNNYIAPLQAELKEAEEKAEDLASGWPDGLEY